MDRSYEMKYHRLEENSWWFLSRRKMLLQLVESYGLSKDSAILEIGCSGGPLMQSLNKRGYKNVHGIDISPQAIALCKRRKIKNTSVMDGAKLKFQNQKFDLVIASDVLEHIKDDISALKEWRRVLKPNGRLIVFVPAWMFLWTSHDEINHHFRRYTATSLKERLARAKLQVTRYSYWNFILFFPVYLFRIVHRILKSKDSKPADQVYEMNPLANGVFVLLISFENWFLRFLSFPVGVSVFAECKK